MKSVKNIKKLVLLALFTAISYTIVACIRIPVAGFLSYEPKDVIITIGGFLLGPTASLVISALVSLLEMVTFSTTGPIGCLMNFLSTCSFACTAAFIYKRSRTVLGAILGLAMGSGVMVGIMLLWNWLITPLYMGVSREVVEGMLFTTFLPFNLLKAGMNTAFILGLYKPLVMALRKAGLVAPQAASTHSSARLWVTVLSVVLLGTCIFLLLVFQGKI